MIDMKKYSKYIAFTFILIACAFFISSVDAATFSVTGTPTQFGWHSGTPEDGTTVEKNTGAVVYYPATIGGVTAFCLDWSKPAPPSGTSMLNSSSLDDAVAAVIYEGLYVGNYSKQAIQLAVYKAIGTTNSNLPNVFNNVKASQYHKSAFSGISQAQLESYKTEANSLISAVNSKGYKSSLFNGSSNATIQIANQNNGQVELNGYMYIGPIQVKTDSGNPITFTLNNSAYGLVSSIGGTKFLTQVSSNQQIWLKVPSDKASGSCKVTFYTRSTVVNKYMYTASSGNYQRFGVVTTAQNEINVTYNFEWQSKYKIKVIKKDKNSGSLLSGAEIKITKGSQSYTKVTGSNGEVIFEGLDEGTWNVEEVKAPNDYKKSDEKKTVTLSGSSKDAKQVVFYNEKEELGRISVKKYIEYSNGKTISANSGVSFQVVTQLNQLVGEPFSLNNGVATTPYLRKGTYFLIESSVNTNVMYKSDQKIQFTIGDEDVNRTSPRVIENYFVNKGVMGEVEVYKYYTTDKGQFPLQGVKFYVYKSSPLGSSQDELIGTITTNSTGKASISDLENGDYYVVEDPSTVPEGFIPDTTKKFFTITDTNKKPAQIKVENKVKKGTLRIIKISNDGTKVPIKDVVFDIYKSDKKTIVAKDIKTDANGIASVELIYGKYWIKEVSAPKYVIMNADLTSVEINDDTLNSAKVYETTLENGLVSKAIKLYKVDNEKNPISGVKFALYTDAEEKNKVAEATTDANGLALFNNLKVGTYYYKELVAPDGYITTKISEMKPISITDANYIYEETIENTPILGKLKIHKIDEEKKSVEGAKFEIKDKDGKVVDTLTTDKDGIAISKDLRKGNYTIEEVYVPEGYVLLKESITFTINTNKEVVEREIENRFNKGRVIVKKIDSDTKEFIDGAVFEIYKVDESGKETQVDKITQYNTQGVGESGELKNGKYYLIETKAPDGAIIDKTKYEFEVTEKVKEFTFTVENKLIKGKIALIKTDDSGKTIEGVKFQILASDKTTVVDEVVTNEEGKAYSKDLKQGTYYVKETWAPEMYLPVIDLVKCEIKEDKQVITLQNEIINKKITGGIKITKNDDAKKPVSGVTFAIYKEGGISPVKTITTNEQGVALANDLVLGKYYFIETSVPDHIYIMKDQVTFEITQVGQLVEKTIVNDRVKGKLVITKTNSENGTAIEGVTFAIYDSNKNQIGTISTDLDGIATTENLKDKDGNVIPLYVGTYYYAEVSAPSRFFFDSSMKSFAIIKGLETVNVTVENTPYRLPQTGGFISTDGMIILIVSIVSIAGYITGNLIINRRRFY